jgi:hypothetical protein
VTHKIFGFSSVSFVTMVKSGGSITLAYEGREFDVIVIDPDGVESIKDTIDKSYQRHRDELESDGVEVLRGEHLRDVRDILSLTPNSHQETVYTPAGTLRMSCFLRDSQVAKAVRTTMIRLIQGVGQQVKLFYIILDYIYVFFTEKLKLLTKL